MLFSSLVARADNTYSNAVMSLAPIAYWPLNETNQPPLPGNIASNLGTAGPAYDGYYGTTISMGESGAIVGDSDTAVSFGTGSGYIDVPYGPAESIPAPFTVETWLNAEGSTATACAVSAGQFGSPRAGWLIYNFGTGWSFRLYNENGTATSLSLLGGTIDSNWHHVVGVFDGTNGYLYQDGVLVAGPTAATGYVPNPNVDLSIGARSDGSFEFNGEIDEVAIYTNALSAAQVSADYQNGINASRSQSYSSLVLSKKPEFYFRLDDTISTPTSSALATNYGTVGSVIDGTYLPGTVPAVAGPSGAGFGATSYACKFLPATGGYVDCGYDTSLDIITPMTVVAWFQGAPADDRFQSFLGRSDASWRADLDPNYAHFADGGNPDAVGQTSVNDGNWHYYAGSYDGTNTYVYIDGELDGTNSAPDVLNGDGNAQMVIGGVSDYLTSRLFKGSVAQVAVFTNALTAKQIQTLYYAGELAPTIESQPQALSIGLGASGSLSTSVKGNPTLVYQWYDGTAKVSDTAGQISGSATATLTLANAQLGSAGNYTVVITNTFGAVTSAVAVVSVTPSPAFTAQPASNTVVYAGNQVNLSAVLIGSAPLNYQWYRGTTAISGANSTNLSVAAPAGTNSYVLVVTNSFGANTSRVAVIVGQVFVAPASGFVVNFDSVANGDPTQNYIGQGAYNDSTNNAWNPIGASGATTGFAYTSASNQTLVTGTFVNGLNNGSQTDITNGTPSWLLSYEDAVNAGNPGIGTSAAPEGLIKISDLPQGTYTVYLYGANYDGTRGTTFTIASVNGGEPDDGISSTTNGIILGTDAIASGLCTFAESDNYVFFTNVVTDPFGDITVTYVPDFNPVSGFSGEAPFNGIQIVGSAIPKVAIQHAGANLILTWNVTNAVLQSSASVTGPYTTVTGATSPYTNTASGKMLFFRVKQ
jgi:hypothetical protein